MPRTRDVRFDITGPARRDIVDAVKWSLRKFGAAASVRYGALLRQALRDVEVDPERPGSAPRPEILIEGARTWHIALSRTRVEGSTVKSPRHFLLYRRREDGVIEVARVLHDSRDLARHLPATYRRTD